MNVKDIINLYKPLKNECTTHEQILQKMIDLKMPLGDAITILIFVFGLDARTARDLLFSAKEYSNLKDMSDDLTNTFLDVDKDS